MSDTIDLPIADAMTARELFAWQARFIEMLGQQAYVNISIGGWRDPEQLGSVGIYPEGMGANGPHVFVKGKDWPAILKDAEQWIANYKVTSRDTTIRKMALAVIELTDEHGKCTADMLERRNFSRERIVEFHSAACERAGEMCANAPFSVEF